MQQVLIATCNKSWHQAIYVGGELKTSDSSLYANEISNYIDGSVPVSIKSVMVEIGQGEMFPDAAEDLHICEE